RACHRQTDRWPERYWRRCWTSVTFRFGDPSGQHESETLVDPRRPSRNRVRRGAGTEQFAHAGSGQEVMCDLVGHFRTVSVRLNAPLGGRVLLDENGKIGSACPQTGDSSSRGGWTTRR